MITVDCKLNLAPLDRYIGRLDKELEVAIRATALKGEQIMKGWIRAVDAIDTGAMMNSVYSVTWKANNYGKAIAAGVATYAAAKPKSKWEAAQPVVMPGNPIDRLTAYVAVGAGYAVYVNYGSPERGIAGAFFLERTVAYLMPFLRQQVNAAHVRAGA